MSNLELVEELEKESKEVVNDVMKMADFTDLLEVDPRSMAALSKLWNITELSFELYKNQAKTLDRLLEEVTAINENVKKISK